MANKKIIELDAASQVNSDALFPLSQLVDSNQKTLKATVAQMQAAMLAPVSGLVTLGESSGSIASFSTDISDKLFSCYVNVVATQAGSGTPAPDNVRAISGWSACNLIGCGKNVFDEVMELGYITSGTGQNNNSTQINLRSKNYIPVKSGNQYYLKSSVGIVYCPVFFYDKDKNYVSETIQQIWNNTITIPNNACYMRFYLHDSYGTSYKNDTSINYPSTDTSYHKYNGTTHNIPFNQTVYGCVLDVLSGVLTVTHGYTDLGDLDWTAYNSTFYAQLTDAYLPSSSSIVADIICSQYVADSLVHVLAKTTDNTIALNDGQHRVHIYDSLKSSLTGTQFKTAMNGVKIVFKLATPITIQLTPTEVKTILGQNNIFADCGDIDLKYLETIGNRL